MRVNLQVLLTSRLRRSLCVIEQKGPKPEVSKSQRGSTPLDLTKDRSGKKCLQLDLTKDRSKLLDQAKSRG
jgi:hypothetical protein